MEVISLDLYFTDFVTKKDRRVVYADQFENDFTTNAQTLLDKVNALLTDLGISKGDVTSGWRPAVVNIATAHSATHSGHMICKAVDLLDNHTQDLGKLIASRSDLLRKYNLFMEDTKYTKGNTSWVHLDMLVRSDRQSRTFIP